MADDYATRYAELMAEYGSELPADDPLENLPEQVAVVVACDEVSELMQRLETDTRGLRRA